MSRQDDNQKKLGPNVKRLLSHRIAQEAIPSGGGIADGIRFFSSARSISDGVQRAMSWVEEAIALVKTAPDNPFGDDDEAIAGEILKGIEARKAELRRK